MFYSRWIELFLILGLINYSYQFNPRKNQLQRHKRDALLKENTQNILDKVLDDQGQLANAIKKALEKESDTVNEIARNILVAAQEMARAGSTDITSAAQWTKIQSDLRTGLNTIIDSYQRYIKIHRQVCDSIETFAKSMISKYEDELSVLDRLSAPTSPTGSIDRSSPAWTSFMSNFLNMMNYANVQQRTIPTAFDSIGDLTRRMLDHYQDIMGRTNQQVIVRTTPLTGTSYPGPSFTLPCDSVEQYNGYQQCSSAIVDQTQRYAYNACQCQQARNYA